MDKQPYEFLARWDDAGQFGGAHLLYRERVARADGSTVLLHPHLEPLTPDSPDLRAALDLLNVETINAHAAEVEAHAATKAAHAETSITLAEHKVAAEQHGQHAARMRGQYQQLTSTHAELVKRVVAAGRADLLAGLK